MLLNLDLLDDHDNYIEHNYKSDNYNDCSIGFVLEVISNFAILRSDLQGATTGRAQASPRALPSIHASIPSDGVTICALRKHGSAPHFPGLGSNHRLVRERSAALVCASCAPCTRQTRHPTWTTNDRSSTSPCLTRSSTSPKTTLDGNWPRWLLSWSVFTSSSTDPPRLVANSGSARCLYWRGHPH
jgi:hypothetical protein